MRFQQCECLSIPCSRAWKTVAKRVKNFKEIMNQANSDHFGTVLLEGIDQGGNTMFEATIPVAEYYSNSHPIIDDSEFRSRYGMQVIRGRICDYDGNLDQEFHNEYGGDGAYIRSQIVQSDGTIIED